MHKLAILADPHYHSIFPGYPFEGVTFDGRAGAAIRTRADSAASTRIFNESYFALPVVLDICVAQGIDMVVIAGDLTDDGQIATMDAALDMLARYEAKHGMRFFLTPGNHDVYGMSGRHHAKVFYDRTGTTTVTSDPTLSGTVVDPAMFCRSYPDLAQLWAPYGIARRTSDLHWESPFGPDDSVDARYFEMVSPDGSVRHRQLDLSYLVEPVADLWLLSIDANVFEPRDNRPDNTGPDAFADSTDAGWNALVRLKPFILEWMSDVAARAERLGKTLICFSHYPVLDTYDGTVEREKQLFGHTQAVRRTPSIETSRSVARTGIGTHFSGHLHVSDTNTIWADGKSLTNIALPSPVAFPPAFALIEADQQTISVRHELIEFDRFDAFFSFYRSDMPEDGWTEARSYGDFLYRHVHQLVRHRFLPKEWPADLAQAVQSLSIGDLVTHAEIALPARFESLADLTAIDLLTDWYAARMASGLAAHFISPLRLDLYETLISAYRNRDWSDPASLQSRLKVLFEMMALYLGERPAPSASEHR